jgi:hypothetical protein
MLAVSALRSSSCGMDAGPVRPGGPCTRSTDCQGDNDGNFVCLQGICTSPEAGVALPDAGVPDSGATD